MSVIDKITELENILASMKGAAQELEIYQAAWEPVDEYFYGKIDEWTNKIRGVTSGYEAEFTQMYKYRMIKGQTLYPKHADVTVGEPWEINAKSIQLKSTIGDHSDVTQMIKVALNQLSGERGETPRDQDRMIVDMHILSRENTWPGGKGTMGTWDWNTYVAKAVEKIKILCSENSYRQHQPEHKIEGFGLNKATISRMTDVSSRSIYPVSKFGYLGHPNSTQLLMQTHGKHPSQGERVIHLSIKLRYQQGYPVIKGQNLIENKKTYNFIRSATFHVVRVGDSSLEVIPAKVVMFNEYDDGFHKAMLF